MKKVIKSNDGLHNVTVETDGRESIVLWQKGEDADDMIMLFNERMARKTIKALKKAAEELGWEV